MYCVTNEVCGEAIQGEDNTVQAETEPEWEQGEFTETGQYNGNKKWQDEKQQLMQNHIARHRLR